MRDTEDRYKELYQIYHGFFNNKSCYMTYILRTKLIKYVLHNM